MPEIFLPTTLEKLKICDEQIGSYAREVDDEKDGIRTTLAIQKMAQVAMAQIVPEMQQWEGSSLEVVTDLARYTMDEKAMHDREVSDDLFFMSGIFKKGGLQKIVEPLEGGVVYLNTSYALSFFQKLGQISLAW